MKDYDNNQGLGSATGLSGLIGAQGYRIKDSTQLLDEAIGLLKQAVSLLTVSEKFTQAQWAIEALMKARDARG